MFNFIDMSSSVLAAPTIHLNNGVFMPSLGLGVYQMPKGQATYQAVRDAFEVGYRHIDTASFYGNEKDVGKAIRESGIDRASIFVTTKIWPTDFLRTEAAFERSLRQLGMEYVDLYLIHWPAPFGRQRAWNILEKIYKQGRAKAIGVSNYSIQHLRELLKRSEVVPAVNQIEVSPFYYRKELIDFCSSAGIQVEAYSPLTRGKKLDDGTVGRIASRYGKTPAQIMIRWSLQHEFVVIPKTQKKERMRENMDVFDFLLSEEDMSTLDGLHQNYRALFA